MNAVDYIVQSAKDKVAKLEQRIEELSVSDDIDEVQLELLYEELEEMVEEANKQQTNRTDVPDGHNSSS